MSLAIIEINGIPYLKTVRRDPNGNMCIFARSKRIITVHLGYRDHLLTENFGPSKQLENIYAADSRLH